MNKERLQQAANISRGLAIDAVHACSSGHLGLPLGAAEVGAVLFGEGLSYHPANPKWLNRDRFILSGGHGSMFLYSWLHLSGFDLPLDEVKNFRQLHSKTPGHPEYAETPGVEATTGPLGQGIGNAVGYAICGKMAAAKFNTADHQIFNYHVVALAGDGCFQEGISAEASSLAGHLKLDNLILIYDSNDVTLDAMAKVTQSEDTAKRYEAYGFEVFTIDGHDLDAVQSAFQAAKANDNGKPKLIIARTEIGRGIPEVAGTAAGHGEGGAKFAESARKGLGLPAETFFVSDEVKAYFAEHQKSLAKAYDAWNATYSAWRSANPTLTAELDAGVNQEVPADLIQQIPEFAADYADATRSAGGVVIQSIAKAMPMFFTGSADLFGSTKNYMKEAGDFGAENYAGRNLWFGIREHAMGAILNGAAYDGIFRPSGATFAVFADYCRPSIRLAALAKLPVVYIFTHDSVGVGEDGPTHQPVETCSGLRVIPGLDVFRPADPEETAGAFVAALQRTDGPTMLLLTRQKVPTLNQIPVAVRREGALNGAYIAKRESSDLQTILLATGSELSLALDAAEKLGEGTRVVSVPCMERFDRQPADYQSEILPPTCQQRIAIEAGVSGLWYKYVGLQGKVIGIDRFGISAPGGTVMKELGITADAVVAAAKSLSGR
ncbi:MAG: transketolase [Planctomycetales bacterium]|nr:transketolase [Planctomycetales bacterium]